MKYISLFTFILLTNLSFSQYDISTILNKDLVSETYNQLIGEVNRYNLKNPPIYNEKRTCIYGDCKNGKSALAITFKGGLYYKKKEAKVLFIAGNFENGKLQGLGYVYHSFDKNAKSSLNKLLKKGQFETAWKVNNVKPKICGVFKDNIIFKGKFVNYYNLFVPYLREALEGNNSYYSSITGEEFSGDLYVNDNNIVAANFISFDAINFESTANNKYHGKYQIEKDKNYPSIKRFLKKGDHENINYLFDKHYILKGLGVTINEEGNNWKIKISSGYTHKERILIDTIIVKPHGEVKKVEDITMFANYNSNNKANGFVSMLAKNGASYTGFMKEGKYHGPGFYMSSDAIFVGRFKNNSIENGAVFTIKMNRRANAKTNDDSRVYSNYTNSLYFEKINGRFSLPNIFISEVKNLKYTGKSFVSNSISYIANRTYSGQLDQFGVPNGDGVLEGKEGYYENGFYNGPTRKQQQDVLKKKNEEKAYWLTQSSCGMKGEWVKTENMARAKYAGKLVCTSKGLATFGWVHPGAANWINAINNINNKPEDRQAYILSMSFPKVTPGNIFVNNKDGSVVEMKNNSVFVVDTENNFDRHYSSCGTCRGSGKLRIMSKTEEVNPVTARYTYYIIEDPLGGYMVNKAIRHKHEKDLIKYGRNGIDYYSKKKVPCTKCFGMGILPKH